MNERIKLLVEEARLITVDDTTRYASDDEFCKKFAELIVKECADIADEYDGVGSTIVSRIKKHFGVEE